MRPRVLAVLLFGVSCARTDDAVAVNAPVMDPGASQAGAEPRAERPETPAEATPPRGKAPATTASPPRGEGAKLTLDEARRYMVTLINRDRAKMSLPPVELDEGAPSKAGQRHAEDMASHGFLGHWGTDGSVPEQRYTEAGGADFVTENASCLFDEVSRGVAAGARFDPRDLEHTESLFFNEVPPNDGHRKNILNPRHRKVGVGIALPAAQPNEIVRPCVAQEFTDPYGSYGGIPKRVKVGETVVIEGTLKEPARIAGVGLSRVDAPRAIPAAEANRRRVYPVPAPYVTYWPPGFKTPIPLKVEGNHFRIEVPVTDGGRPGLYGVSVWAKLAGSEDFVMVSLRTLMAERR